MTIPPPPPSLPAAAAPPLPLPGGTTNYPTQPQRRATRAQQISPSPTPKSGVAHNCAPKSVDPPNHPKGGCLLGSRRLIRRGVGVVGLVRAKGKSEVVEVGRWMRIPR
jgi:hypothetical protein